MCLCLMYAILSFIVQRLRALSILALYQIVILLFILWKQNLKVFTTLILVKERQWYFHIYLVEAKVKGIGTFVNTHYSYILNVF